MINRIEFQEFAKTLITEEDKARIKRRKIIFGILGGIFLCTALVVLIIALINIKSSFVMLFPVAFLVIMAMIFFAVGKNLAYNGVLSKYKPQIIAFLLGKYKYTYNAKGYLSKEIYAQFNLPTHYDTYSGEDYLALNIPKDDGTPSTTDLQISQIRTTEYYEDSDGDRKERTLFNGTLGIVNFDFQFPCYLAVGKNYFRRQHEEDKIETEDTVFNKNFKTYSDNELEAFRILTPDLMLKLTEIHKRFDGIDFVFRGNKLFIYIHGKDLFAIKAHKEGYEKSFEIIYDDIEALIAIIKEIQTNNKVFKF